MTSKTTPTERNTMPSKTDSLPHADWCEAERVETTDYPDRGITTHHCLDCGAHEAKDRKGNALTRPAVTGGMANPTPDPEPTMRRATLKDVNR